MDHKKVLILKIKQEYCNRISRKHNGIFILLFKDYEVET